jgi:nitrate reductase beta subunit
MIQTYTAVHKLGPRWLPADQAWPEKIGMSAKQNEQVYQLIELNLYNRFVGESSAALNTTEAVFPDRQESAFRGRVIF